MLRSPTGTPNSIIKKSILKVSSNETPNHSESKRSRSEFETKSPNSSEKDEHSSKMIQRLEGLEAQLKSLNETIQQLNHIISDLRKENNELKEMLKKNDAKNDKQIAPKQPATYTQRTNTTKPTQPQKGDSKGNNNINNSDGSSGSGSGSDSSSGSNDNNSNNNVIDGDSNENQKYDENGMIVDEHEHIVENENPKISFTVEDNEENNKFETKRNKKIPPIDIWSETTTAIQKRLNETFPKGSLIFWRINKSKFRVFAKSLELREKLIEYLSSRGIHFNTYKHKDEKLINILIKNSDIDDEELIRSELLSIGIEPHTIKRYETGHMRKNNVESKIWHLLLHPNTDTQALFEKRNIGAHIVKYEYLKKPTITQCKRCQRFNHSASSCYLPYRCVKCANQHEPGKCPMDSTTNKTKLKCANCGGAHTANNAKQCPAFAKAIQINEEKKKENTKKKQHKHSGAHQTNTDSSQQPKQMSGLFKPAHTNTRTNSYTNTQTHQPSSSGNDRISLYLEQQQRTMFEFMNNMMKSQSDFIKRMFDE